MDEKPNPAVFIHRLKESMEAQVDTLKAEGNVPGTGVSNWDMMINLSKLKQFHTECKATLASGNNCTGDFNLTGGKKMHLDVSFENGADVTIESKEGAKRQINIRPAAAPGSTAK